MNEIPYLLEVKAEKLKEEYDKISEGLTADLMEYEKEIKKLSDEELLEQVTITTKDYWNNTDEREGFWDFDDDLELQAKIDFMDTHDPYYDYYSRKQGAAMGECEERGLDFEEARDAW